MIPNDKTFNGKPCVTFEGTTYYRRYNIQNYGDYRLRIHGITTNSPYKQGIALFFSEFQGKIQLYGKELPVFKEKFKHYVFSTEEIPHGTLVFSVHAKGGSLIIANASARLGAAGFTCGTFGNAFWIEKISENHLRFHCNDHELDDDFNDLLFDLTIETITEI